MQNGLPGMCHYVYFQTLSPSESLYMCKLFPSMLPHVVFQMTYRNALVFHTYVSLSVYSGDISVQYDADKQSCSGKYFALKRVLSCVFS